MVVLKGSNKMTDKLQTEPGMPGKTKPVPVVPASLRKPKPLSKPAPKKKFKVETYDIKNQGERIVVYADSGLGKTTLVSLLNDVVFIDLYGGSDKIKHPVTGKPLKYIPGVETFQDVRDALQSPEIFEDYGTVCIDTTTRLEQLAEPWIFANILASKNRRVKQVQVLFFLAYRVQFVIYQSFYYSLLIQPFSFLSFIINPSGILFSPTCKLL